MDINFKSFAYSLITMILKTPPPAQVGNHSNGLNRNSKRVQEEQEQPFWLTTPGRTVFKN